MSSSAKDYQAALRHSAVQSGWQVDEVRSRDLHFVCIFTGHLAGVCGISVWETGALNGKAGKRVGTLQATAWCRHAKLEALLADLFGSEFDNPFGATAERSLRRLSPSVELNDLGVFPIGFDNDLMQNVAVFWASLSNAAQIFFQDALSGTYFENPLDETVSGSLINWEARTVVWQFAFAPRPGALRTVLANAQHRLDVRIEADLARRAPFYAPEDVACERDSLKLRAARCMNELGRVLVDLENRAVG